MTGCNINDMLLGLQSNMLNYALMLTSDRSVAYSLLQKATLEVLDRADRFDGDRERFKPWVFSIMRGLCQGSRAVTDADMRRPALRMSAADDDAAGDAPAGCYSVDSVMYALGGVPPKVRVMVRMHLNGATADEIERAMKPRGYDRRRISAEINRALGHVISILGDV